MFVTGKDNVIRIKCQIFLRPGTQLFDTEWVTSLNTYFFLILSTFIFRFFLFISFLLFLLWRSVILCSKNSWGLLASNSSVQTGHFKGYSDILQNTIYLKVMEKYNAQYLSKPGTAENSHRLTKQSLTGRETKTW